MTHPPGCCCEACCVLGLLAAHVPTTPCPFCGGSGLCPDGDCERCDFKGTCPGCLGR